MATEKKFTEDGFPMKANPYVALAEAVTGKILAGGRHTITGAASGLAERLHEYATYCTENMKTTADALLVQDLHAAADIIARRDWRKEPT